MASAVCRRLQVSYLAVSACSCLRYLRGVWRRGKCTVHIGGATARTHVLTVKERLLRFLPDIEHIYMSEKNSNRVKEIDDIQKMRQRWLQKMRKSWRQKSTKFQNNSAESRRQRTRTELRKNPTCNPPPTKLTRYANFANRKSKNSA